MTTSSAFDNLERLSPSIQDFIRAGGSLRTFDYTAEQWMEIAQSLQQFLPKQETIETVRSQLRNLARSFLLDLVDDPRHKQRKISQLKHWNKASKLADSLMSELTWLARNDPHPPDPSGETPNPYNEASSALMKISVKAKGRTIAVGKRIDDGYPTSTRKAAYHSNVLQVWTTLGGKLRISRHPSTGKIKGPLARYFSAVTKPVHGGSPESLPDIIKRHLARNAALDKWRLDGAIANYRP
jgi:hypothetical protein